MARRHVITVVPRLGFQCRLLLSTDVLRQRASCAKTASRRWADGTWYLALEHYAPALPARDRLRNRREEGLRVGVEGSPVQLFGIPQFDDLAKVHDGDAVAYVADDSKVVCDE